MSLSGKNPPIKLVSVAEMIAVERAADASGLTYAQMMENAGTGLAAVIQDHLGFLAEDGVLGLVGSGNNGGDALVAMVALLEDGWKASAYIVRPRSREDALLERFREAGGAVVNLEEDANFQTLAELLETHGLLLDGILGTGIQLPLRGNIPEVLGFVKEWLESSANPPYVVAVDCPSGVDCDRGLADPVTLPADLTVTMAAIKQGLLMLPAYALTGGIELVSIGLDEELPAWQAISREVISATRVAGWLPERTLDAHKGTFGTALICAGSLNYTGAAYLAGRAAYLSGAGLVTLAVPSPLHPVLAGFLPEATWLLLPHEMGSVSRQAAPVIEKAFARATALLVGPGFGLEETTREFIERLLARDHFAGEKRALGFVPENANREEKNDLQVLPP
jgi:ADP-dependent NAD(P)H-hydrate dehydratase / NAD(P)H-hydrate epimerase